MVDELAADPVRVSVVVNADLAATFRLFTEKTDIWWKRGPRNRIAGTHPGTLHLEPRVNGRLFESFDVEGVTRVVRTGRVRVWEPPARLVFEWRAAQCAPNEVTEAEVTFAPDDDGTRVTLTHRGWHELSAAHPARQAIDPIAAFWGELLDSLASLA